MFVAPLIISLLARSALRQQPIAGWNGLAGAVASEAGADLVKCPLIGAEAADAAANFKHG